MRTFAHWIVDKPCTVEMEFVNGWLRLRVKDTRNHEMLAIDAYEPIIELVDDEVQMEDTSVPASDQGR